MMATRKVVNPHGPRKSVGDFFSCDQSHARFYTKCQDT